MDRVPIGNTADTIHHFPGNVEMWTLDKRKLVKRITVSCFEKFQ